MVSSRQAAWQQCFLRHGLLCLWLAHCVGGLGLRKAELAAETISPTRPTGPTGSQRIKFLLRTLDRFKDFAVGSRKGLEERHKAEDLRLHASIGKASGEETYQALEQVMQSNQASLLQTASVYDNMFSFADSMQKLLGSMDHSGTCETLVCGPHAACTHTPSGGECVCDEGFVGTGHDCHAPPAYRPQTLLYEGTGGTQTQAEDMHICTYSHNEIAVVFRDLNRGAIGRIVLGTVYEGGYTEMAPPQQFTVPHKKAFSPVVAGSDGRRLVVAWRDANRRGVGYARSVAIGTSGIRGADMAMQWGEPVALVHELSQKMAIVPLPGEKFAVLYVEKILATDHTPVDWFGNSALLHVDTTGSISHLGNYRFTDSPICRLDVTRISPSAFVIAGRMTPQERDEGAAQDEEQVEELISQEAVAIHGRVVENELFFGAEPLVVAANQTTVWARGVSLIAANTVAYAYQAASPHLALKMAIIEVDNVTREMSIADGPITLRNGFSPTVSMLSVPYSAEEPHTLALFKDTTTNASKASLCSYSTEVKEVSQCSEFDWMSTTDVLSSAGVHLPGGKAFMVFTPPSKVPHFTIFGIARRPLYDIYSTK